MLLVHPNKGKVLSSSFFANMENAIDALAGEHFASKFSINGLTHLDALDSNMLQLGLDPNNFLK